MGRLEQIVAAASLRPGEAVLDVGTGLGVLVPLIKPYRPAVISACDLAERMLRRVREKYARAGRPASRKSELIRRAAEDGLLE